MSPGDSTLRGGDIIFQRRERKLYRNDLGMVFLQPGNHLIPAAAVGKRPCTSTTLAFVSASALVETASSAAVNTDNAFITGSLKVVNRGVWRHGEFNGFMVDGLMRRVGNDDGYLVFPGGQPDQITGSPLVSAQCRGASSTTT